PPTADVTIQAGQSVNFQGIPIDLDGKLSYTYTWEFGGGAPVSHVQSPGPVVFATSGVYRVAFTVTDQNGLVDRSPATRSVTVLGNQLPSAALAMAPATGNAPLVSSGDASGSADPDGTIVSYAFDFGDGAVSGPGTAPVRGHTYVAGNYTARVTVTDNRGGTRAATAAVIVAPVTPGPNLALNPSAESNLSGWAGTGGGVR